MGENGWLPAAFWAILSVDAALLAYALARRAKGKPLPFTDRWNLADVWFGAQLSVLLLIVLMVFQVAALTLFAPRFHPDFTRFSDPATVLYFVLPSVVLQNVAFFAVPAGFIQWKYRLPLREIGLPLTPTARDWRLGLGLGLGIYVLAAGLGAGIEWLAEIWARIPWVHAALEFERTNPVAQIVEILPRLGVGGAVLALLGIGIGAAFGEEMFFRGFLFNALKQRFGIWPGILVSALLFTVLHTYALGLIPVFLLGVLLAWSYQRTGSLWVPILIHATNNTLNLLGTLIAAGVLAARLPGT